MAAFPDVKNRSWDFSVDFTMPAADASGTLVTQGGNDNGWGLFLFGGVPTFVYKTNNLPGNQWRVAGARLGAGRHTADLHVVADSAAPGAGAMVSLVVDGAAAASTHVGATVPYGFQGSDGVGIGRDFISTLSSDYTLPFRFPGEIGPVRIHLRGSLSR